ncbi:S8 family serine peptidase [Myxosarcina sp. GI1]|uniref:S8 family serine peptidase n=1 Tax=Myxosarcina sp. GI1 TaxID=1541065 RepID=UPI0009DD7F91|nr:S8 family serine peptidase [Myxosarcina sp. GI1]
MQVKRQKLKLGFGDRTTESKIKFREISRLFSSVTVIISTFGALAPATALGDSIGDRGIQASRLHQEPYNLLGRKIGIGQIEIGRPGKFGIDKLNIGDLLIAPHTVFFRDLQPKFNDNVDEHAGLVAEVMIANHKALQGVAPKARLYASAVGSLKEGGQPIECLTSQHIALQNGGDVRAINFSFGESLERDDRDFATLDGRALLTECIDWSARKHNVLYVIAGNQGKGGIPIPTDNYNGITTAYTTKRQGLFNKVDFANLSALPIGIGRSVIKKEINKGLRRAISLLAPGSQISLYNRKGELETVSGTSFAAPHITASVALLQEYGDRAIATSANKSLDSRRHEVMKAILLNSADKIRDAGDNLLLGMERTILNEQNQTWLDSDAYKNPRIPFDIQMGTGHLNAFRAYQQLSAGQNSPDSLVSPIGWDYRQVRVNSYRDYYLEQPLVAGSHAAITLAWDRLVLLNDRNQNGKYDVGETFRDRSLNNLDIYLMPASEKSSLRNTCSSLSSEDSAEHIFCPIPATGRYKIRVYYRRQMNEAVQPYALAWWTVSQKSSD